VRSVRPARGVRPMCVGDMSAPPTAMAFVASSPNRLRRTAPSPVRAASRDPGFRQGDELRLLDGPVGPAAYCAALPAGALGRWQARRRGGADLTATSRGTPATCRGTRKCNAIGRRGSLQNAMRTRTSRRIGRTAVAGTSSQPQRAASPPATPAAAWRSLPSEPTVAWHHCTGEPVPLASRSAVRSPPPRSRRVAHGHRQVAQHGRLQRLPARQEAECPSGNVDLLGESLIGGLASAGERRPL
jgi:hypothetical protein